MRFLLGAGASPSTRSDRGETPLDVAQPKVKSLLRSSEPLVMRGEDSSQVQLRVVAQGGTFKREVFFSAAARLSPSQRTAQPTLFMCESDWLSVSKTIADMGGPAFGDAHDTWSTTLVRKRHASGYADKALAEERWVVVWRFPLELATLSGFQPILNVPLPVCSNPMRHDSWWASPVHTGGLDQAEFLFDSSAEELRVEVQSAPRVLHALQSEETGARLGLLSVSLFVSDVVAQQDQQKITELVAALYEQARVYAFPCVSQHLGIVLYLDVQRKCLVSPEHLAALLADESAPLLKALRQFARPEIEDWKRAYVSQFRSDSYTLAELNAAPPKPSRYDSSGDRAPPTQLLGRVPRTADGNTAVLLMTGAMNPIHSGHVVMLQAAAKRLRLEGLEVTRAFLSPDADDQVQPAAKACKTFALSAACGNGPRVGVGTREGGAKRRM